MKTWRVR